MTKAKLQESVNGSSMRLTQLQAQVGQLAQKKDQLNGIIMQGTQAKTHAVTAAKEISSQLQHAESQIQPLEQQYQSAKQQLDAVCPLLLSLPKCSQR